LTPLLHLATEAHLQVLCNCPVPANAWSVFCILHPVSASDTHSLHSKWQGTDSNVFWIYPFGVIRTHTGNGSALLLGTPACRGGVFSLWIKIFTLIFHSRNRNLSTWSSLLIKIIIMR
jgi:hypothetical protein